MNIIQHSASAFHRRYSDVTSFVIIKTSVNNFNLITHSFSVTVANYSYHRDFMTSDSTWQNHKSLTTRLGLEHHWLVTSLGLEPSDLKIPEI